MELMMSGEQAEKTKGKKKRRYDRAALEAEERKFLAAVAAEVKYRAIGDGWKAVRREKGRELAEQEMEAGKERRENAEKTGK
jgi:hypothetical protein